MKKTLALILLLTLVLSLCGQAFAQKTDYEAAALQKAQEAWAAQSATDPVRSIAENSFGPTAADEYEMALGIQGGIPVISLTMEKTLTRFADADVPLDLELLGRALEAADSETQERIRAEMQWGRPRVLTVPPEVEGGEPTVMAEFFYDGAGRRTAITADDFTVAYAYDEDGRLSEKRLEVGELRYVIRYSYDAEGREIGRDMDANGQTARFRWDYDPQGRLIRSDPANSATDQMITFTWDENGALTGIGNGEGGQWLPSFDSDAHGFLMDFSYDGNKTLYQGTFDQDHRITETELITGAFEKSTKMQYDEGGGCLSAYEKNTHPNGQDTTETLYNAYGCQMQSVRTTKSNDFAFDLTVTYQRDKFGRCTVVTAISGEGPTADSLVLNVIY